MSPTILKKTLNIISSSNRTMPARFSRNGTRTQSFCIDFPALTPEADEKMAAQAYGAISFYLSNVNIDYEIDEKIFYSILMVGEDIMIGSFILEKFKCESSLNTLKQTIIKTKLNNLKTMVPNLKTLLTKQEVKNYLQHCADFGKQTAKNN